MSFERSLSIADELEDEINEEARKVAFSVLNGVIVTTPRDTGRAAGNWFVGINSPDRSVEPNRRSGEAVREGAARMQAAEFLPYPEIILSNSLPYIERLNTGYSLKAPAMFVEIEIKRVTDGR